MSIAVVILSKTLSNFQACSAAIRRHEPLVPIVLVDDGGLAVDGASNLTVPGQKPFVFARNANIGIRAALESPTCDGVVLCNDDALLESPAGFSKMAVSCTDHPDFGVISATTNVAGNANQFPHLAGSRSQAVRRGHPAITRTDLLRHEPGTLAFVCIYISRRTWDLVGPLDERFVTYGWEDNDYCRRVKNAGLNLGIFDGCFVNHSRLPSSFRGKVQPNLEPGRRIYLAKWGSM